MGERWTWDASARLNIVSAFDFPDWCDRLESAADALVSKVLCVCAASALAREVVGEFPTDSQTAESLELLAHWIDDPTQERFDRICDTIFGPDVAAEIGPYGVGLWALRTVTSSVGNGEAGWALSSTCGAAEASGMTLEAMRSVAERAVFARQEPNLDA